MPTLGESAVQTLVLSRQSVAGIRLAVNPKQYKVFGLTHAISSGFSANHSDPASHVTLRHDLLVSKK